MIRRLLERRRYMREHEWSHAHLSEYIDDELPPAERARLEDHTGICPECTRVLATLRRTVEALMGLGKTHSGKENVADGVLQRLRGST